MHCFATPSKSTSVELFINVPRQFAKQGADNKEINKIK